MEQLLNFSGRIRRMGWWIAGIGMSFVSASVNDIRDRDLNVVIAAIFWAVALVVWLIGLSLSVRRWHDLDKSGWWVLVMAIPVLGWLYSLWMLGFQPGDQGHNNYGPPPREGAILG